MQGGWSSADELARAVLGCVEVLCLKGSSWCFALRKLLPVSLPAVTPMSKNLMAAC
jgi:hypothetical protein